MSIRKVGLQVIYNGYDATADLSPYLLSWDYTDNAHGKLDSVSLVFEDKAGLWRGVWNPQQGDTLELTIFTDNWYYQDMREELYLGIFEIDEPEYSGPPDTIAIKGLSLSVGSSLRGEERYKSWEEVRLSKVAREIADAGALELFYDVKWDPYYDRLEQQDKSALEFLLELASREALGLKLDSQRLVIYDRISFEEIAPAVDFTRGDGQMISYSFRKSIRDRYAGVHLEYEGISYDYDLPGGRGKILCISGQRVASLAEAERVAKRMLWEKNIRAASCNITCLGNIKLMAGMNIHIQGFDSYDGLWQIDEVNHSGAGYRCAIKGHKVLASADYALVEIEGSIATELSQTINNAKHIQKLVNKNKRRKVKL